MTSTNETSHTEEPDSLSTNPRPDFPGSLDDADHAEIPPDFPNSDDPSLSSHPSLEADGESRRSSIITSSHEAPPVSTEAVSAEEVFQAENHEIENPETAPDQDDAIVRKPRNISNFRRLVFTGMLAVCLTVFTSWFASFTFKNSLYTSSPIFHGNSQSAILILQLLASVSVMAVSEVFLLSCEEMKLCLTESIVHEMILKSFSKQTDFWELSLMILTIRHQKLFSKWRAIAGLRFLVLYVVLVLAQFIWLLEIAPRTSYQVIGSISGLLPSRNDFSLDNIAQTRYEMLSYKGYLSNVTAHKVQSTTCAHGDAFCAAFVLGPSNLNISATLSNSTVEPFYFRLADVPTYMFEFKFSMDLAMSWPHCMDYTTIDNGNISTLTCVGTGDNSSVLEAFQIRVWVGFDQGISNPDTAPKAFWQMSVYECNATMMLDQGLNIVDVPEITARYPYPIKISDYFIALTAPFQNLSDPQIGHTQKFSTSSVSLGDAFLKTGQFNFKTDATIGINPPAYDVMASAFGLNTDVGSILTPKSLKASYDDPSKIQEIQSDKLIQTYVLSISPASFYVYVVSNTAVLFLSIAMLSHVLRVQSSDYKC
jgi:hypothetical protein